MTPGIDVSHYQGQIDWQKVADSGVKFCYIKASEGAVFRDQRFRFNWDQARAAGVIVGAYHYFKAAQPVILQVPFFFSTLATVTQEGSLPIAFDIEEEQTTQDEVLKLLKYLADYHSITRPVIYMDRHTIMRLNLPETVSSCHLWYARYTTRVLATYLPWLSWTFWQSGYARTPGIATPVDQDQFNGDLDQLKALTQKGAA